MWKYKLSQAVGFPWCDSASTERQGQDTVFNQPRRHILRILGVTALLACVSSAAAIAPTPHGLHASSASAIVDNQTNWTVAWCEVTTRDASGTVYRVSGSPTCTNPGEPVPIPASQVKDAQAPSGDGDALFLLHWGGTSYANILRNVVVTQLGPTPSTLVSADLSFKLDTPQSRAAQGYSSPIEAIEFGLSDWLPSGNGNGLYYEWAWQWDVVQSSPSAPPCWNVLVSGPRWQSTGLCGNLTTGIYHHLVISGHVDAGGNLVYDSLTLDGALQSLSVQSAPVQRSGYDDNLRLYVQLDGSQAADPYAIELDNAHVSWSKSGPTNAHVTDANVASHGTSHTFQWYLPDSHGVVGFNLFAGSHHLNTDLIPVHARPRYTYRIRWRGSTAFVLQVVLKDGRSFRILMTSTRGWHLARALGRFGSHG